MSLIRSSFPAPGVLLLSLARPPVNALHTPLFAQIRDALEQADRDPEVRCVVFASAVDKGFTAGLDLHDQTLHQQSTDPARTALLVRDYIAFLQSAVSALEKCSKPVVAAVHGLCIGGGIDLISACDVRLCSADSVFSIKEVDIALAADLGSLQRLPKTTSNASLLAELALTARNFGPAEADKLGLVSQVVKGGREAVLDAAVEVAKVIASKSPIATLSTKHLLNYSRDHTVQEGLEYTQAWNMSMIQCADIPAAFSAFSTKRRPEFADLPKRSKL
ncbi:hypothetical protein JCM6882_004942 [Rhodosporidiobolus microsporus]